MKLKEVLYGLGLRPAAREYPFELVTRTLPEEGEVSFARWLHPSAIRRPMEVTQGMVDALRAFLRPGDVAIDIGAHAGDTTLPMALAVGPEGAVFALEPNRYVFKVLLANVALNRRKTNIFPLMFAATPEDGDFEFEYSDAGFCNGGLHEGIGAWRHAHFFRLPVKGRHLISYLKQEFPGELERVRYVKVDTEGFDRSVTASLRDLLVRNRPFLRTEIFRFMPEEERRGYWRDLRELGYRLHRVQGEEELMGEPVAEESAMTRWPHFDLFCSPEKG